MLAISESQMLTDTKLAETYLETSRAKGAFRGVRRWRVLNVRHFSDGGAKSIGLASELTPAGLSTLSIGGKRYYVARLDVVQSDLTKTQAKSLLTKGGEKKLLWLYIHTSIYVLVPKKRGSGFLMAPYGHHINPELEDVRQLQMGGVDIFGLDGCLQLCVNKHDFEDPDEQYATKLMTALSGYYQMPFEKITSDEYFRLNPVGRAGN